MNYVIVRQFTCEFYDPDCSVGWDELGDQIYDPLNPKIELELELCIHPDDTVTLMKLDLKISIYETFKCLDEAFEWLDHYATKLNFDYRLN